LGHLEKLEEARPYFDEAILHLRKALQSNRARALYLHDLRAAYQTLAGLFLVAGKHTLAAETAEELLKVDPENWQAYHMAAGLLAGCADEAAKDATLSPKERAATVEARAGRAVQLLREAVARGFADSQELRDSPTYGPIRPRTDFQDLLRSLEKKGKVPKA
jgi:tetratricopeptide (TPR) repeat protein